MRVHHIPAQDQCRIFSLLWQWRVLRCCVENLEVDSGACLWLVLQMSMSRGCRKPNCWCCLTTNRSWTTSSVPTTCSIRPWWKSSSQKSSGPFLVSVWRSACVSVVWWWSYVQNICCYSTLTCFLPPNQLSVDRSFCPSVCRSICTSVCIWPSVVCLVWCLIMGSHLGTLTALQYPCQLSLDRSFCLPACLPACLFLSTCLSVCPSPVRQLALLSASLSVWRDCLYGRHQLVLTPACPLSRPCSLTDPGHP